MEIMERIRVGTGSTLFISDDGPLYEGTHLEYATLVVPTKLIQPVIEMHHDKMFAGLQGVKRTRDVIKLNYFWASIERDVGTYVRQSEPCATQLHPWQRSYRNVTAVTNTKATVQKLLDVSFPMRSASYQGK
jgi:hypothetical protein